MLLLLWCCWIVCAIISEIVFKFVNDIFNLLVEMDGGFAPEFADVLDNDFAMGDGAAFGVPFGGQVGGAAAAGVAVPEAAAGQGHGGGARLQWTNVMSGFVLRRFADLVAEGVRTDKGFKDVHLNAVARDLSEFINLEVSGTQVYNHLRKWRSRWVKICRLKELSGAGWDEANYVITLDPEHYNGHVKVNKFETLHQLILSKSQFCIL